jgi:hypothetical protein
VIYKFYKRKRSGLKKEEKELKEHNLKKAKKENGNPNPIRDTEEGKIYISIG